MEKYGEIYVVYKYGEGCTSSKATACAQGWPAVLQLQGRTGLDPWERERDTAKAESCTLLNKENRRGERETESEVKGKKEIQISEKKKCGKYKKKNEGNGQAEEESYIVEMEIENNSWQGL